MDIINVTAPFIDVAFHLSEGAFWEPDNNVLRFVDIVGKALYRVDLAQGSDSLEKTQYADSISVTGALESSDDSFIFGGKYGIGIGHYGTDDYEIIQVYWTKEEETQGKPDKMRANDGAVDSQGRFWVSAVDDPTVTDFTNDAVLFRYDPDSKSLDRVITGATIPNGISWSPDDATMYYTETTEGKIYAYDYDAPTGAIDNRRDFFVPSSNGIEGSPDGHTQDAEGNLWVALWGGWKVVRVDPSDGRVTAEIRLPTRCPTSVAIAKGYAYITSEEEHEPDTYPDSARYAGRVFKAYIGVDGREPYAARV